MPRLDPNVRLAGLLVPAFALRHPRDLGIGDTLAVREAIDFCAAHGFSVLQILPIHETIGDHSPYNPVSSRALSPALLALTPEEVPGLAPEMLEQAAPESWRAQLREGLVKHNSVLPLKLQVLMAAFYAFRDGTDGQAELGREFAAFQEQEAAWLPAYTLYRLLVREYEGNTAWYEWRPEHQSPHAAEDWLLRHARRARLGDVREGFAFVQWVASRQWRAVRAHAARRGVHLMGEMSFGVSRASADVWQYPGLFDRDWSLGTQPLAFFDTTREAERWGQNWGFPAFRWENHRSTGFDWLRRRVEGEARYFHLCRLDHLRGYFRVYQFPWLGGPQHAEFAQLSEDEVRRRTSGRMPRYVPGPDDNPSTAAMNDAQGRELIGVIRAAAGEMYLIAELLGKLPDYMKRALEDLAMPDLTFPQHQVRADGTVRPPAEYRRLSLVSYANHDNPPLASLYLHLLAAAREEPESASARELARLLHFAGWSGPPPEELGSELLEAFHAALFATPCQLAVLMSSDLLGLPQRFNLPGSFGRETWSERLECPLSEYARHPVLGARIQAAARLIRESGRQPGPGSPAQPATPAPQ